MPPYTEFMNEAKRAVKPAYTQITHDARKEMANIAANPTTWGLEHDVKAEIHEAKQALGPSYFRLANGVRTQFGNAASAPAAMQLMHGVHNGMHVATAEMLHMEQGDGMWGMVIVLFFIAFILMMFYLFGFFERLEAWLGVFLILMVFVFYIDFMTGDHYTYYKTEPYQGVETNTAY
eukprot:609214-Rhodomonas_salina.3